MGDQGFAWLIFNVVIGGYFFFPTLVTLLFRRDRLVLLVLALNVPVLWYPDLYCALYAVVVVAIFWPEPKGAFRHGPTLFRPDKRKWLERQCPSCAHWIERTANRCDRCGETVVPMDQPCPRCNVPMSPAATYCLSCGFDQAKAVGEPVR